MRVRQKSYISGLFPVSRLGLSLVPLLVLPLILPLVLTGCRDRSASQKRPPEIVYTQAQLDLITEAQPALDKLATDVRALTIMVDPDQARSLFKDILETVQTAYPPASRRVGVALNDYGAILNITGTPRQALPYHERAVEILRALGHKSEKSADDLSRALANLGESHVRLNQLDTGRIYYQDAYDISPHGLPAHPDDIARGTFPLLIAANWREFFTGHPEDIFTTSDFVESKTARDEANRIDQYARAQDLGVDPDAALSAWMAVLPAMQKAYPPRSRKVLIATGNRGAVLGFFGKNDQAKDLQNINIQGSMFYGAEIFEDALGMARKYSNMGWARARLNEMGAAEDFFLRSHEIVTQKLPDVNEDLGDSHRSLAHIANWRGDFAGAIAHAQAGLVANRAAFGGDHNFTLTSYLDVSRAYSAAGLAQKSEAMAREGLSLAVTSLGPHHRTTLYLQAQMAEELSRQGRYYDAKSVFEEALAAERRAKGDYRILLVDILMGAAKNLIDMGRADTAVLMAQEAARVAPDVGGVGSNYHTNALMVLGEACAEDGQYEQALEVFNRVIVIYEAEDYDNTSRPLVDVLGQKARVFAKLGRLQEALNLLTDLGAKQTGSGVEKLQIYRGDRLLETRLMAQLGAPGQALAIAWPLAQKMSQDATRNQALLSGLAQDAKSYRQGFEHLMSIAVLAGDDAKALWAAQQLLQSSASRASEQAVYRDSIIDVGLRAQLKHESDLVADLTIAQSSYVKMATRDPDRARRLEVRITTLEDELVKLQKNIRKTMPDGHAQNTAPLFVSDIRMYLREDEAVIMLVEGFENFYTILITKKSMRVTRADLTASDIRRHVVRLRRDLSSGLPTNTGFDMHAAHDLYRAVFSPETEALLADVKHLKIAANGAFSRVSLAVLIRSAPTRSLKDADWLIRRWSVATLASVHTLQARGSSFLNGAQPRGFLGIGDPRLGEGRAVSALGALPNSRREIETIASSLGRPDTQILLGVQAQEATLSTFDFNPFGIVLFSTHGVMSGEITGLNEPALVLSAPENPEQWDGYLTASEISRFDIPADWIILSACNTAAGADADAPGLTGLARAFLSAGGRSLLVSHWPVRDDVATALIPSVVEKSAAGGERAEALRLSMLALMTDATIANAEHPAVWAPFVLVGE